MLRSFVFGVLHSIAVPDSCPAESETCVSDVKDIQETAIETPKKSIEAPEKVIIEPLDVITQEINLLRERVQLQNERIESLTQIKSLLSEDTELPEAHRRILTELLPPLASNPTDVKGHVEDFVVSRAKWQNPGVTKIEFLTLRTPRPSATSSEASTMPSALLASLDTGGEVCLFDPDGQKLAVLPSPGAVSHFAVSQSQDDQFIVVGGEGKYLITGLRVRASRISREERQRRRASFEKISQHLNQTLNVTVLPAKHFELPGRVATISLVTQRSAKYILLPDEEGGVNVVTRNGTFKGRVAVAEHGSVKIHNMVSYVVAWSPTSFGFLYLDSLTFTKAHCEIPGFIETLAADPAVPQRLYLGLTTGEVYVADMREKHQCRHEFWIPAPLQAPMALAAFKGFLLGVARDGPAGTILAANLTAVPKRVTAQVETNWAWKMDRATLLDWASQRRSSLHDMLATLSADGEIEIFEILMKPTQPQQNESISNFKMPVMALAVFLALGYQYMKGNKFGANTDASDQLCGALRGGKSDQFRGAFHGK